MIYVASSWRNEYQPRVVEVLRENGFEVYDFRHPVAGDDGFSWGDIASKWLDWTVDEYVEGLQHPLARGGFAMDMDALQRAEAVLLVLPCGRSAHLEAGWAKGAGKKVVAYIPILPEPELMYKMFDLVTGNLFEAIEWLQAAATETKPGGGETE